MDEPVKISVGDAVVYADELYRVEAIEKLASGDVCLTLGNLNDIIMIGSSEVTRVGVDTLSNYGPPKKKKNPSHTHEPSPANRYFKNNWPPGGYFEMGPRLVPMDDPTPEPPKHSITTADLIKDEVRALEKEQRTNKTRPIPAMAPTKPKDDSEPAPEGTDSPIPKRRGTW